MSNDTAQFTADLVIIGSGGAGLTAASIALEQGVANIVILEKAANCGGNTTVSAGMFAIDSPAQKRQGIELSRGKIFDEKMAYANWRIDPGLTLDCIDLSGPMVAWLETKGMRFENVIDFMRPGRAPRVFHSFSLGESGFIGKPIVEKLSSECLSRGVRILKSTAVTAILMSEGKVAGVLANAEGQPIEIAAPAVILATGGFGASPTLMEKYFPGHSKDFTWGKPELTGDGLLMAEACDAEIDNNKVLLGTGPHHYPWSHPLTLLVRRPDLLLVNKLGERYSNETIFLDYHTEAANALSRQPGMICYGLLDSSVKARIIACTESVSGMEKEAGDSWGWRSTIEPELESGVARGTVFKADSWEALGVAIGAAPGLLSKTVDRYNSWCKKGCDEEFYKDAIFLQPLSTPPFYAILGRQGFDSTLGGIRVDRHMQVIGLSGAPLPGLYAVGDCASGWEHESYNIQHPGSAMTFALCGGYIAARKAAEYIGR
jgi:fumarate reductase flavoprotein subunit